MSKESLLTALHALTVSVEALPQDVFEDGPGRRKVQEQIASIKAAVDTPIEAAFEIMFQVRSHE